MRHYAVRRDGISNTPDACFAVLSYSSDLDSALLPKPALGSVSDTMTSVSWSADILEGFNTLPVALNGNTVPINYENYHRLYKSYSVYASSIEVTAFPMGPSLTPAYASANADALTNTTTQSPILVSVVPAVSNTANLTETQVYNDRYVKKKICGLNSPRGVYFKHYMTSSKLLGIDYGKDTSTQNTMDDTIGNDPLTPTPVANRWRWYLSFDQKNHASNPPGLRVFYSWKIKWYVKFFNRRPAKLTNAIIDNNLTLTE